MLVQLRFGVACVGVVLSCLVGTTAHADSVSDYLAAVQENAQDNVQAAQDNVPEPCLPPACVSEALSVTCQMSPKLGGPLINPGINVGFAAVFPQDYVAGAASCVSLRADGFKVCLNVELERRTGTNSWTRYDLMKGPCVEAAVIDDAGPASGASAAHVPLTVLHHTYNQIPDPNIGPAGSIHRGRFVLYIIGPDGSRLPYSDEFTAMPWSMAPW